MKMWLMRVRCTDCNREAFGNEDMEHCPYCGNDIEKVGMVKFMPVEKKDIQKV